MPHKLPTQPAESVFPETMVSASVTTPPGIATHDHQVTVPGYEILRELGRGGMGVVYLAKQVGLDRLVALKMVLHPEFVGGEQKRRFINEARTVAKLSHPNVVQIHSIDEHNGLTFFSLEYCAGGTLADRLASWQMEPRAAAELVRSLALAVHAAHEQEIVHRDLKPGNILFTADGTPRVADFGLARRADAGNNTMSGAVIGTPSYMAPEQAEGKSSELGPHTDVWGLGAILYECLTGRPPFKGASPFETLKHVVEHEPSRPSHVRSVVPVELELICLRCLAKDPADRPTPALALADELRDFLASSAPAGEPIESPPPDSPPKTFPPSSRRSGSVERLSKRLTPEARRKELELLLTEFYRPLETRLRRNSLNWRHLFILEDPKRANTVEGKVAEAIERNYLLPNHDEMIGLIERWRYLVRNDKELGEVFDAYIAHVAVYKALRAAGERTRFPLAEGVPWPEQFAPLIDRRIAEAEAELAETLESSRP